MKQLTTNNKVQPSCPLHEPVEKSSRTLSISGTFRMPWRGGGQSIHSFAETVSMSFYGSSAIHDEDQVVARCSTPTSGKVAPAPAQSDPPALTDEELIKAEFQKFQLIAEAIAEAAAAKKFEREHMFDSWKREKLLRAAEEERTTDSDIDKIWAYEENQRFFGETPSQKSFLRPCTVSISSSNRSNHFATVDRMPSYDCSDTEFTSSHKQVHFDILIVHDDSDDIIPQEPTHSFLGFDDHHDDLNLPTAKIARSDSVKSDILRDFAYITAQ